MPHFVLGLVFSSWNSILQPFDELYSQFCYIVAFKLILYEPWCHFHLNLEISKGFFFLLTGCIQFYKNDGISQTTFISPRFVNHIHICASIITAPKTQFSLVYSVKKNKQCSCLCIILSSFSILMKPHMHSIYWSSAPSMLLFHTVQQLQFYNQVNLFDVEVTHTI